MKCWLKLGNRVGIFLGLLFIVCFAWYWLRPVNQELHMDLFELLFYGFSGMNFPGFILGIIQSYVWGYIGAALWCISSCCGKCKTEHQG